MGSGGVTCLYSQDQGCHWPVFTGSGISQGCYWPVRTVLRVLLTYPQRIRTITDTCSQNQGCDWPAVMCIIMDVIELYSQARSGVVDLYSTGLNLNQMDSDCHDLPPWSMVPWTYLEKDQGYNKRIGTQHGHRLPWPIFKRTKGLIVLFIRRN
jgi:hypothetical protein